MSDPLAQLHTLPATERSGPLHYLEVNLDGLHWQLTERPSTTSELIIYSPTPALLAALHAATSSACHDGKCPCFKAGEEVQRDPP